MYIDEDFEILNSQIFKSFNFIEAPRGVCAPLIPENNALISPDQHSSMF